MTKYSIEAMRKEQIIEGTKQCIFDIGLSNLSMKDIAEQSELSTGVIYHYFKNKEELLTNVLKDAFKESHEEVMKSVEPLEDRKEKLAVHWQKIQSVSSEHQEYMSLVLNFLGEAKYNREINEVLNKHFYQLTKYIEKYLYKGETIDKTQAAFPIMVIALGIGLNTMWTLNNDLFDIKEMEELSQQFLLQHFNLIKGEFI